MSATLQRISVYSCLQNFKNAEISPPPVNHKGCLHKLLGSTYLAVWANEAQLLSVFKVYFTAILSPCRPAGTPLERPPPLRRCWQRPGAAALPAGESGNK